MIGIFLLALCMGAGMAHDIPHNHSEPDPRPDPDPDHGDDGSWKGSKGWLYSCPASSNDERAFRELCDVGEGAVEIPSIDKALDDLSKESTEIRASATEEAVRHALVTQVTDDLAFSPFVRYCCPFDAPINFDCTSVRIPIWRIYFGKYGKCWVVFPYGERRIHRIKCTCVKCVYKDGCPYIGRCVETGYEWRYMVVYCPKYGRYFKIYFVVPTTCECRPYCPWWVTNQLQLPNGS